jgi:hypothetical protein
MCVSCEVRTSSTYCDVFGVTRHRNLFRVTPRQRIRGPLRFGVPAVTSQQSHFSEGRLAISLQSTRRQFRPDPEGERAVPAQWKAVREG